MRKKTNWFLLIIMVAAFGTFLFAAGKLIQIYLEYQKGKDTYQELQEYVKEPQEDKMVLCQEKVQVKRELFTLIFCFMLH